MRDDARGTKMTAPAGAIHWPFACSYLGLIAWALSPGVDTYWATGVAIIAISFVPAACPSVRLVRVPTICPLNIALLSFFLQLVVAPLLVCFYGPYLSTLPAEPSAAMINGALLLSALAFAAFGVGFQYMSGRLPSPGTGRVVRFNAVPVPVAVVIFAMLGIAGVILTFGGLGGISAYFANAAETLEGTLDRRPADGARVAVGTILRSFLGFAVVLAWCAWIDRYGSSRRVLSAVVTFGALAGVLASYSTFTYNRGAFVAPVLCVLAVYGIRVRAISLRTAVIAGLVSVLLLSGFREYRSNSELTLLSVVKEKEARLQVFRATSLNKELQFYAGAPQFSGFALEEFGGLGQIRGGGALLGSVLDPIPVIGRKFEASFQASSGTRIYNEAIYGVKPVVDQILPLQADLFINFHIPGVALGYALLGAAFSRLQARFVTAVAAFDAFCWQYVATWSAYLIPGGATSVSLVFFYFLWPVYVMFGWSLLRARHTGPRGGATGEPVPATL